MSAYSEKSVGSETEQETVPLVSGSEHDPEAGVVSSSATSGSETNKESDEVEEPSKNKDCCKWVIGGCVVLALTAGVVTLSVLLCKNNDSDDSPNGNMKSLTGEKFQNFADKPGYTKVVDLIKKDTSGAEESVNLLAIKAQAPEVALATTESTAENISQERFATAFEKYAQKQLKEKKAAADEKEGCSGFDPSVSVEYKTKKNKTIATTAFSISSDTKPKFTERLALQFQLNKDKPSKDQAKEIKQCFDMLCVDAGENLLCATQEPVPVKPEEIAEHFLELDATSEVIINSLTHLRDETKATAEAQKKAEEKANKEEVARVAAEKKAKNETKAILAKMQLDKKDPEEAPVAEAAATEYLLKNVKDTNGAKIAAEAAVEVYRATKENKNKAAAAVAAFLNKHPEGNDDEEKVKVATTAAFEAYQEKKDEAEVTEAIEQVFKAAVVEEKLKPSEEPTGQAEQQELAQEGKKDDKEAQAIAVIEKWGKEAYAELQAIIKDSVAEAKAPKATAEVTKPEENATAAVAEHIHEKPSAEATSSKLGQELDRKIKEVEPLVTYFTTLVDGAAKALSDDEKVTDATPKTAEETFTAKISNLKAESKVASLAVNKNHAEYVLGNLKGLKAMLDKIPAVVADLKKRNKFLSITGWGLNEENVLRDVSQGAGYNTSSPLVSKAKESATAINAQLADVESKLEAFKEEQKISAFAKQLDSPKKIGSFTRGMFQDPVFVIATDEQSAPSEFGNDNNLFFLNYSLDGYTVQVVGTGKQIKNFWKRSFRINSVEDVKLAVATFLVKAPKEEKKENMPLIKTSLLPEKDIDAVKKAFEKKSEPSDNEQKMMLELVTEEEPKPKRSSSKAKQEQTAAN